MTKKMRSQSKGCIPGYWKIPVLVGITVFVVSAANAQKSESNPGKAPEESRVEKKDTPTDAPKFITFTELRQLQAAAKASQGPARLAQSTNGKIAEPKASGTSAVKVDNTLGRQSREQ